MTILHVSRICPRRMREGGIFRFPGGRGFLTTFWLPDAGRRVGVALLAACLFGLAAHAQEMQPMALDYAAAQHRFIDRSDAVKASDSNVRSKEAQERSTRNLYAPDVDFEFQLLDYQKTLYLPLGSLAPIAGSFGISDPLKFREEKVSTRPILSATFPLYTGGQIEGTQAGARAQVAQAQAEQNLAVESGLLQLTQA